MKQSNYPIQYCWLVVLLAVILSSCSWISTVKRYRRLDKTVPEGNVADTAGYDESKLKVTMDLSDTKVKPDNPKPSFKSLWDLQGQGQRELIQTLDKRFKDTDDYEESLGTKYLKDDNKPDGPIDFTHKKVQLVFSISRWHPYELLQPSKAQFSLADRVEYMKYSLELEDDNLHFLNWDKYSTQYGSINIADVSFQGALTVGAGIGDSTSGAGVNASGSASVTENQHIQYRYIQLNGSLQPKKITLQSEGTREIDLSGNVVAEVTMQFEPLHKFIFELAKAKNQDGSFKTPDKVNLKVEQTIIPQEPRVAPIKGKLTYTYAYRHVEKGTKTFFEWDDRVQYFTGTVTKEVQIFTAEEVLPDFFTITQLGTSVHSSNNLFQVIEKAPAEFASADLVFPDEASADDFLAWINSYPCPDTKKKDTIQFKNGLYLYWNEKPVTRSTIDDFKKTGRNQLAAVKLYTTDN